GSGKSSLAKRLSAQLSIALLEEDSIHFTGSDFTLIEKPIVHATALQFTCANSLNGFVTDGNWADLNDILMPQINIIIELNYPLYITFWRLFKRTFWRCWTGQKLWGTDTRETFVDAASVWKKDNIFRHTVMQWYKTNYTPESRGKMREMWYKEGWGNLSAVDSKYVWNGERVLLRFQHPTEVEEWLKS
ncbi:hypothetical protein BDR26DRAFT_856041, partial [Obelidium mucronatum]